MGGADPAVPVAMNLIVGFCVPNSCSQDDAQGLASTLLSLVPINTTSMAPPTAMCQEESLELDGKAIAAISVAAILLAVTVAGTAYDVIVIFFLHNNRTPKAVNLLGWLIATVLALLVLYGLHNPDGTGPSLSKEVSALYIATSRTVWGACVCWVVYAWATGYGGPVNTLLSWRAFIPLSRLSYCAYLIHPAVQFVYYMSRCILVYYTDIEMAFVFMGQLVASYAAALLVSLVFEVPRPKSAFSRPIIGSRKGAFRAWQKQLMWTMKIRGGRQGE